MLPIFNLCSLGQQKLSESLPIYKCVCVLDNIHSENLFFLILTYGTFLIFWLKIPISSIQRSQTEQNNLDA